MTNRDRLGALDGLRGLMCLWVLIGHSCAFTGMNLIPVLRSPSYAVDGFMLLSGFLMTFHYILRKDREPWTSPTTWMVFYIRRFFRISPLYYLVLLPAYLFLGNYKVWRTVLRSVFLPTTGIPAMPGVSLEHVIAHLTYIFGVWPKYHASLGIPDWSLSLEMQFYCAFPFLVLAAMRIGWIPFSCAASAVYMYSQSSVLFRSFDLPSPLPLSCLWFVIGMVWAHAFVNLQERPKRAVATVLFATALSLLSRNPHDVLLVVGFCWILFGEHRLVAGNCAGYLRRALSGKTSRFLAEASYSVYLIHLLFLFPLAYALYTRTSLHPGARFAIVFTVTAVLSYAASIPLGSIERLGIRWGKRLSESLANSSALGSSPDRSTAAVRVL